MEEKQGLMSEIKNKVMLIYLDNNRIKKVFDQIDDFQLPT